MVSRSVVALASLIFTAGAIVLQFFVILSGSTTSTPMNKTYFLRVDTAGIPNALPVSQWNYWRICAPGNVNCGAIKAANPFDPPRNFHTHKNIPSQFIESHKFYYLSRFVFAFFLISLFFSVISLFIGFTAMCGRLGGALSGLTSMVALLFQSVTAALMTVCFVIGRDDFRKNGHSASLGRWAFGFTWAAVACLLISSILFFCGCGIGSSRDKTYSNTSKPRFGRKASTRSRGSFGGQKDYA